MAGAAISFRKVSKRYGAVDALLNFDLDVAPGEFMTFLGPSGSGKTTALNILAGFTTATSGDVLIDGKSVLDLPPEKRGVGMVFQNYSLFPHMNVFDNIAFPLRLRKVGKKEIRSRVEAVLSMVRLEQYGDRMPKELSGGQRQRVAFARAVVFEPSVLLMDEPLGALDLKLRQAMQLEIRRYHSQLGCSIVFVTHDQGEALGMSDRIAVMANGRIAQVDTPSAIYDRPVDRYVAEFIGRTNIFHIDPAGNGSGFIRELNIEWPASPQTPVLSVRPEKIARISDETAGFVLFDARVDEVLFQGDIVHYGVALAGGGTAIFQEHRERGVDVLLAGRQVRLGFRYEDALPIS